MNKENVTQLMEGIEAHSLLHLTDLRRIEDSLKTLEVSDSGRFYAPTNICPERVDLGDEHQYISFRRVLRNEKAQGYHYAWKKKAIDTILDAGLPNRFSTVTFLRRARADEAVAQAFLNSTADYSLVGRIDTYALDESREPKDVSTQPFLVIPGQEYNDSVRLFENFQRIETKSERNQTLAMYARQGVVIHRKV